MQIFRMNAIIWVFVVGLLCNVAHASNSFKVLDKAPRGFGTVQSVTHNRVMVIYMNRSLGFHYITATDTAVFDAPEKILALLSNIRFPTQLRQELSKGHVLHEVCLPTHDVVTDFCKKLINEPVSLTLDSEKNTLYLRINQRFLAPLR